MSTLFVPFQVYMVALIVIVRQIGLTGNLIGLLLVYIALGMPVPIFLVRSYATGMSLEIEEAATIDGCSNTGLFLKIVLPLSMPILAVIGMFYMVGHWNSFFNALLYLNNNDRFPLQMIIREILVINSVDSSAMADFDPESANAMMERMEIMRYSLVVVASAPMLILFPFVQKYFVKGLMIGAVKG